MDTYIETLESTYMAGREEDYNDTLEESIYSIEEIDDWGYLNDEAETDDELTLHEENEFEDFEMVDDYEFGSEDYILDEPIEYELDEWEESLEDAEVLREVLHEDYSDSPSEEIEEALKNILDSMTLEEGLNFKKILSGIRSNSTVGQILQQGLPMAGAAVGTIYGGPLGTALGGAAGNYAAQAFTVKPKGTKRPSRPKNITRPSAPVVRPKKTSPNGGSTAAAKLLQLTQNPDVLKSLLALSLGKHGKQEIKTDKSGKNVKVGAVMNLLSTLLGEAVDDADELARTGSQSSYLYDSTGKFLVDPTSSEQRAGLLYESIVGPDYVNYTTEHEESLVKSDDDFSENETFKEIETMRGSTNQREDVNNYRRLIEAPLSRGLTDWWVTDSESLKVVRQMDSLSDSDLLDTYNRMQRDGLWSRLYEQAPSYHGEWHNLRWRLVRLGQPVLRNNPQDKRLAKLHSALSAGKRAVQATMLVTTDPKVLAKMKNIEKHFGLAARTLNKGMKLNSATKAIHKLSRAASRLDNVRQDRYAAAQEFGNLLSAAGELGKFLPPGPWQGYFTLLGGFEDFFVNMAYKMDPKNRGGGRFRKYMPE